MSAIVWVEGQPAVVNQATGEIEVIATYLRNAAGEYIGMAGRTQDAKLGAYELVEKLTGEAWVDGKLIYRKVIDCSGIANAGALLTGISSIVRQYGRAKSGANYLPVPCADGTDSFRAVQVIATGAVTLARVGAFATPTAGDIIVIEYTKA